MMMPTFLNLKSIEQEFQLSLKDFPQKDKKIIQKALELARQEHANQERDEGGPYIAHCLRIATYLIKKLKIKSPEIISAALLHDTIEDTNLKIQKISQKFGKETADLVNNLTRNQKNETPKNRYQKKYHQFLSLMKKDKKTRMIKACDWLDNMKSWQYIPPGHKSCQKFPRWFKEAKTMYIPLAKTVDKKLTEEMKKELANVKKTHQIKN